MPGTRTEPNRGIAPPDLERPGIGIGPEAPAAPAPQSRHSGEEVTAFARGKNGSRRVEAAHPERRVGLAHRDDNAYGFFMREVLSERIDLFRSLPAVTVFRSPSDALFERRFGAVFPAAVTTSRAPRSGTRRVSCRSPGFVPCSRREQQRTDPPNSNRESSFV
jgi:hypothetical protein